MVRRTPTGSTRQRGVHRHPDLKKEGEGGGRLRGSPRQARTRINAGALDAKRPPSGLH
ncbi:hypothetical protein HBB16_09795 [Pseudonocardia sp. MCCB 268]|nr:hypothetical protein [Pseudonocardia cytotoxica]